MSEIPRRVLSDEIQSVIGGRRLRAAVFLTFRFDPGFFEQEVLPIFFDISLSHVPEIRLINLAEALLKVDGVAVYYDRIGLEAGSRSSKLDVQRVAVSYPTGYFHPKNILLLVEDDEKNTALIVATLSANLTRAGWWENVEVAHIEEIKTGDTCSFRDDLRALIRQIRVSAVHIDSHPALEAIDTFIKSVQPDDQRMRGGVVLPRLLVGEPLIEFLNDIASYRLQRCNLEILSPYFDNTESLGPIQQLRDAFRPQLIRIFLPRGLEGQALCSERYYKDVSEIAQWGRLPDNIMRLSRGSDRTLHAKVYRFFDPERDYQAFFVGSVNLTGAAFNRGGNMETGFFVEMPSCRLDWWLTADRSGVTAFMTRTEEEGLIPSSGCKLSLRYRWSDRNTSAFWDQGSPSPPLTLIAHGVELGRLGPVPARKWVDCPTVLSIAIEHELRSSAFITVRIDGEEDAQILVDEEDMTYKPSLISTFTVADILRYWSFLTVEQKKEFLEEHAEAFDDPEIAMWLGRDRVYEKSDSLFTTFAEVYIAFGNLERSVQTALADHREKEAVDRLFGGKFDSLRRLVDKVIEETSSDIVRTYITLLNARQLLKELETHHADFCLRHPTDVGELRSLIEHSSKIRNSFTFGSAEECDAFFRWYDRWFLAKARPIAEVSE